MSSNKSKTPWEPKDKVNYKNLYGRKIIVYNNDNEKTEGILTSIFVTKSNHKTYGLVMKPYYTTYSQTFCGEIIHKVEIEYIDEIKPLIISKCDKDICLDISNIILDFTNTYIEI
tara:strand:+ start:719 stop:1063 length:345 start_codon:yes stop_codon:yes gene_type:complete